MIVFFIPFLLSSWFLFYLQHKEIKTHFSQILRVENPRFCPQNLRDYFLEDKRDKCFPPVNDHSRNQEKNGAKEVVCLLLLETNFQMEKIKCPFP